MTTKRVQTSKRTNLAPLMRRLKRICREHPQKSTKAAGAQAKMLTAFEEWTAVSTKDWTPASLRAAQEACNALEALCRVKMREERKRTRPSRRTGR